MRTSISLDDNIAKLAEQMAQRENRNFSNLCEIALSEYCAARGAVDPTSEMIAAAQQIGLPQATAILVRAARRRKPEAVSSR